MVQPLTAAHRFGNAAVEGGLGTDSIRVIDSIIGDEAADRVTITDTTMANVGTVETKGGNDRIDASLVMAFAFAIDTDKGADIVNVTDMMTAEDVRVFTGTANDRVNLTNVMSGKYLIAADSE
ncbi:MAG: hypothetical protein ACK506_03370 [Pirellula sp.]|jgi:hypothetical protein